MPVMLDARPYGSDPDADMLEHYARHFGALVDREVRLLEIGIGNGGSLRFWADYFPLGRVVGLDVEPLDVGDAAGRIFVYRGVQQDVDLLDRIAFECAPGGFDIVIDDASHIGAFTRVSFWRLFTKHVKAGGIFVIED